MLLRTWIAVCLLATTAARAEDEDWRKRKAGQFAPSEMPTAAPVEPPKADSPLEPITFDLPPKLALPSIPRKPLDDQLRIALILPGDDPEGRADVWYWDLLDKKALKHRYGSLARPVATVLPTIIAKLFPRMKIVENVPEAASADAYDLVLHMRVRAVSTKNSAGLYRGVMVQGTLTASRPDGREIGVITAAGEGWATRSFYWSLGAGLKAAGTPAIEKMLDQLVRNLIAHPEVSDFLQEHAAARARPSQLETTVRFADASSIIPNGRLDAGETAQLAFTVRNRGAGQAFGVRLRLSAAQQRELTFPGETPVGDLLPGAETIVAVTVSAGLGVQSEAVQLHVDTVEKRGYGGRPLVAEIATERLHPPTLEIADVGLAAGRPANGETLEATVVVRNSGPGPAAGVELFVSADDPRLEVIEPVRSLPPIAVDDATRTTVRIRVPATYDAGSVGLTLRAVEARGEGVAQTKRSEVWRTELRRPSVEIAYRLYDGNSTGSTGNRDGVANSGERLELVLTAANRGSLTASDVQLAVASPTPGLIVQPDQLVIGDLPPNVEAAEQRIVVQVPRTAGRGAQLRTLPLSVTTTQRDFEKRDTRLDLTFEAHQPELVLALAETEPLVEGHSAALSLDVRNQGPLAAERVQVEVTSANGVVDLLDERGAPASKRVLDVGTIAARTSAPPIELKVHVKRSTAASEALLRVIATQQDEDAVTEQATLRIAREQPATVTAIPEQTPAPLRTVVSAPPTVAFRRYEEGEHVADESIALRFEVQSVSGVDDRVRLAHNGRVIALDPPRLLRGSGGRLYEQQISLDYGANVFEIVVVTGEGMRTDRTLTLHRDRPDGRLWIAVVGISEYAGEGVSDLSFARKDAEAVAAYYAERFALPEEQIIQIFDDDATLANIKRRLNKDLAEKATNPNDTVILYFAGHGLKERDRASADADGFSRYILPHDADRTDLASSALGMEELARILQRLHPERVALILDSCFSGAAGGGRTLFDPAVRTRGVAAAEYLTRLAGAGKGRVVLTASGADELAIEPSRLGHGVFTYFLLEGLRGAADDDRDGQVDVDEIYKYVLRKVEAETRGRQRPMKKASSQSGIVVLGKTSLRQE
jgi:uncharacterized caspase-like protein